MTNTMELTLWFVCLTILVIGGLNWIITACRTGDKSVPDLLNLFGLKQNISNIIYWIVGIVSIITLVWAIQYQLKRK